MKLLQERRELKMMILMFRNVHLLRSNLVALLQEEKGDFSELRATVVERKESCFYRVSTLQSFGEKSHVLPYSHLLKRRLFRATSDSSLELRATIARSSKRLSLYRS